MICLSPSAQVLPTWDPYVSGEIVEFFSNTVRIPASPVKDSIKSYLGMRLKGGSTPKTIDDELIVDRYSGMDISYGIVIAARGKI